MRGWRRTVLGLGAAVAGGCQTIPPDEPRPSGSGSDDRSPTVAARVEIEPGPTVPAPPTVPADAELPLDLGTALTIAGVDNPTIALARERVREAVAIQLAARSLLLPHLSAGANVRIHRGNLQRSAGQILDVDSQSVYAGLGARALGSSAPTIPGVWLLSHIGDAAYEPQAARQQVTARAADATATNNSILLDVTVAYFDLTRAEAVADSLRQSEAELAEVVRLTRVYAETGEGRAGDANRAVTNAALFRKQVQQADEDAAVAAARLTRLLNLDPSVRPRPPGGSVTPVALVDENQELAPLVEQAVRGRPELAARAAAVGEAQVRVRQERVRPWLPTLSVGFSGGQFGGGSDFARYDWSPARTRTDFDVVAYWTAENLGVGNVARVRAAGGVLGQAVADLESVRNQVRAEVAAAQATARAAAGQIRVAEAAVRIAEEGFRLEMARIKEGEGLPLEVLDSFRQLADSRVELIRATVAYTTAQFRLLVALGIPPS